MSHDFEHPPSSECNHQGLMSYNKIKETWSTCSVKDFKTWWRKTGFGCKEIKSYHSKFFVQIVICLMILLWVIFLVKCTGEGQLPVLLKQK